MEPILIGIGMIFTIISASVIKMIQIERQKIYIKPKREDDEWDAEEINSLKEGIEETKAEIKHYKKMRTLSKEKADLVKQLEYEKRAFQEEAEAEESDEEPEKSKQFHYESSIKPQDIPAVDPLKFMSNQPVPHYTNPEYQEHKIIMRNEATDYIEAYSIDGDMTEVPVSFKRVRAEPPFKKGDILVTKDFTGNTISEKELTEKKIKRWNAFIHAKIKKDDYKLVRLNEEYRKLELSIQKFEGVNTPWVKKAIEYSENRQMDILGEINAIKAKKNKSHNDEMDAFRYAYVSSENKEPI